MIVAQTRPETEWPGAVPPAPILITGTVDETEFITLLAPARLPILRKRSGSYSPSETDDSRFPEYHVGVLAYPGHFRRSRKCCCTTPAS